MGGLVSLPFRIVFSFLLGIALFLALWETALFNVSARPTAVGLLTEAGVGIINPALTHSAVGTFGLSESGFAAIQAAAAARPNDPVTIPGLNVEVRGSEIAGKSFDDATRVVYGKVAAKFYDSGAGATFSVPGELQKALGLLSFIPVLGGASSTLAATASPLTAVGLSLNTLTAAGHAQVQTYMLWLWLAAAALALVIVLLSRGWSRVRHVAHPFVGSSLLGVALIGLVWYLWRQNPSGFATFSKPLNLVGGAFTPVYRRRADRRIGGLCHRVWRLDPQQVGEGGARRSATRLRAHGFTRPRAAPHSSATSPIRRANMVRSMAQWSVHMVLVGNLDPARIRPRPARPSIRSTPNIRRARIGYDHRTGLWSQTSGQDTARTMALVKVESIHWLGRVWSAAALARSGRWQPTAPSPLLNIPTPPKQIGESTASSEHVAQTSLPKWSTVRACHSHLAHTCEIKMYPKESQNV